MEGFDPSSRRSVKVDLPALPVELHPLGPPEGLEPSTTQLKAVRSTTELGRPKLKQSGLL